MNRLHHIKQTLYKNIIDNINYGEEFLEFVILDYNSQDGLEDWIREDEQLRAFCEKGIVKCYRAPDPTFFDRSHSRNMCMKLGQGEIICNVDADNFLGENFAEYINEKFVNNESCFIVSSYEKRDCIGKVCIYKADFLKMKGYDERMSNYGFEDLEFYNRLELNNIRAIQFRDTKFTNVIHHDHIERVSNEKFFNDIEDIYLSYITPWETDLMLVFKNKDISIHHLQNSNLYKELYSIESRPSSDDSGALKLRELTTELTFKQADTYELKLDDELVYINILANDNTIELNIQEKQVFTKVTDIPLRIRYILMISEIINYQFYMTAMNKKENLMPTSFDEVNSTGFGEGYIYEIIR